MNVTRLAPSPTGALHLGNARTFLINYLVARQQGWTISLRIEDLDGPRIRAGAGTQALDDLSWLGLNWDAGPTLQSDRAMIYNRFVRQLVDAGRAYPCVCSRREIDLAASAPHAEDGAAIYPGTCRGRFRTVDEARRAVGREPAIRFRVDGRPIEFVDAFAGPQRFDPTRQLGDFVIQKSDGTAAYQLAVVVDDHDAGVTQVIRGDDLIDSTPRQMMLYRALGWTDAIPAYTHLPLVIGSDGRRLAKRHGDSRLSAYRAAGVSAGRVLTLLARWSGVSAAQVMSIHDLLGQFDLARVSRMPVVFTADDDAWLRQGAAR